MPRYGHGARACGLLVLWWLTASTAVGAPPASVSSYPMHAQRVADGVYAVVSPARAFPDTENRGWNSNSAFVVTREGVLVFDTGSSETIGRALKAVIAGVTPRPVRWVINSHAHGDHWLGNVAVAGPGVSVLATPEARDRMAAEGSDWVARFSTMTGGLTGASRLRVPDAVVTARETRELGGVRFELIPVGRSHSPGDLVVWLPEQRVLLGGDVVYSDRMPAVFDGDIRHWIQTLKTLEGLAPKHVVPGHGRVSDSEAIRTERAFLQDLWSLVERGYAQEREDFEVAEDARRELASYRRAFPDFDASIGRVVSRTYPQVEAANF